MKVRPCRVSVVDNTEQVWKIGGADCLGGVVLNLKINRKLLRDRRTANGWTQEKLAEVSGVHVRTIQRIENDGVASIQTISAIGKALDLELSEMRVPEGPGSDSEMPSPEELASAQAYAKALQRINNMESLSWIGWTLISFGGYLLLNVMWMVEENQSRESYLFVLLPGVGIGLAMMMFGTYWTSAGERAKQEKKLIKKFFDGKN